MQVAALISILVYVSLWEYMMIMYRLHPSLPYRGGYTIFAVLQWPVIATALIHIFGWAWGIAALVFSMTVLQYFTHFSLGLIYNRLFKNPLIPLALFCVMFWVNIACTILLVIF
jgi:hypothetical protein